ncbi:carbohydrate-binding protein [Brachybacterium sp. GPGPB12]|uniref:carbohydrate-binding protein n=1 Tax=Brachybacterium sp. GPGPB12 TaxID=3023517 RepID=UPI0031343523
MDPDRAGSPRETPAPTLEVPDDIAPAWTGSATYEGGEIVLFDGTLYQARWWTQGDSPESAHVDASTSPWRILDDDEVTELVESGGVAPRTSAPSDGGGD